MAAIGFGDGEVEVDAALVAEALDLTPAQLQALLREGAVTSRCERGVDEDAGRWRLTFYLGGRRLRLIVNETGAVLRRSLVDVGDRPAPRG